MSEASLSNAVAIGAVLRETATAIRSSLDDLDDWGSAGTRPGQYLSDLAADAVAVAILTGSGMGVVSEESGEHYPERRLQVSLDPVDGSTNASRRLPWYATSMCVLDQGVPWVALVVNQATGEMFEAVRGEGATRDGLPISPTSCHSMSAAVVGLAGWPSRHMGWRQMRALGAAALDLCAVASGSLDAYIDCSPDAHAPWDYLGGLLICGEAGAAVAEASGRELVTTALGERRSPVAAATPALLAQILAARAGLRI